MTLRSTVGAAGGGALMYVASLAANRERSLLAFVLTMSALALAVWAMLSTAPFRASLGWVQALSAFGAGMSAAITFHVAIRDHGDTES